MSHELRTPLNSLLILSKLLAENDQGNLSEKQLEFSRTIHTAGTDLLELISDILDLSKIEAGKMEILPDPVALADVREYVQRTFGPVAGEKGLTLEVLRRRRPADHHHDRRAASAAGAAQPAVQRVQVHRGRGCHAEHHARARRAPAPSPCLTPASGSRRTSCRSSSRPSSRPTGRPRAQYGGTGLGLSISRELARALGGELRAESTVGVGSSFTLLLPLTFSPPVSAEDDDEPGTDPAVIASPRSPATISAPLAAGSTGPATESAKPAAPITAVVGGGPALTAGTPPNGDGWDTAAADTPTKRLLIVERGDTAARAVGGLVGRDKGVSLVSVTSEPEACEAMADGAFDCVVLGGGLPKATAFAMLERLGADRRFHGAPVLLCLDRELTERDRGRLRRYTPQLKITVVASAEQLTAETAVALHRTPVRPAAEWSVERPAPDDSLKGRKVLLVDDDVRNLFALASLLEDRGMEVVFGETGQEALAALERQPDIEIVLMDLMMPGMDGYETMAATREMPQFGKLPIIAVTAKAMQGDREKCLQWGASDYITKPVEPDKLMALIRGWLAD